MSFAGELDRIAREVDEDLPHAAAIPLHVAGRTGRKVRGQLDALLIGSGDQQVADVVDDGLEIEGMRLELQLVGLDLGEVENVVDQREQRVAGLSR